VPRDPKAYGHSGHDSNSDSNRTPIELAAAIVPLSYRSTAATILRFNLWVSFNFFPCLQYSELIRNIASMKDKYPPGTVIQILDEWNEGDRSYYVVVDGDKGRDRVDIISTFAEGPLIPRERIRTDMFRVIAYCDAKGNLELVSPEIGGTELSLARKASRAARQTPE
jgi:hypothetical protein